MWLAMLDRVEDQRAGRITLGTLVTDVRGLFVEADPHDSQLREDFETYWSPIDAEYELRTEPWAPRGAASEEQLKAALDRFVRWVTTAPLSNESRDHG